MTINPNDTAVLFAATDKGIYRSADGGDHWHQVSGKPATLLRFEDSGALYAIEHDAEFWRVIRSTDEGTS